MAENEDWCPWATECLPHGTPEDETQKYVSCLSRAVKEMLTTAGHPEAPVYIDISETKDGIAILACARPRKTNWDGTIVSKEEQEHGRE